MNTLDGKKIAAEMRKYLKDMVLRECKKKRPRLVVFSVKPDPEGASFIRMKQKATEEIGGEFELIQYKKTPLFFQFAKNIKKITEAESVTGVVLQKPLPSKLATFSLFDYVPLEKEIEGHKAKSPFYPPIALAALTVVKFYYAPGDKSKLASLIINMDRDEIFFKQILKKKKIVIAGRGETGGQPIANVLRGMNISFIQTNSKTDKPEQYYKQADIIFTCVGRKIITQEMLKPGVVLINIGLHRRDDAWRGDYDEDDVKDVAAFYTKTPGGTGPFDIAYLMYNLVEATKMQQ